MSTGQYGGDITLAARVEWQQRGRAQFLCIPVTPDDRQVDAVSTPLSPAVLAIVGRISKEGYYMDANANWRRKTPVSPHLYQVKGSMLIQQASVHPWGDDWTTFIRNMMQIQGKVVDDSIPHKEWIIDLATENSKIRVRHPFFTVS